MLQVDSTESIPQAQRHFYFFRGAKIKSTVPKPECFLCYNFAGVWTQGQVNITGALKKILHKPLTWQSIHLIGR